MTFTREQREAAFGWNPAWGAPRYHDQHVREYRMGQDDLVAEQLQLDASAEAFYAEAEAEIRRARAAYLADPSDDTFAALHYAQLALA